MSLRAILASIRGESASGEMELKVTRAFDFVVHALEGAARPRRRPAPSWFLFSSMRIHLLTVKSIPFWICIFAHFVVCQWSRFRPFPFHHSRTLSKSSSHQVNLKPKKVPIPTTLRTCYPNFFVSNKGFFSCHGTFEYNCICVADGGEQFKLHGPCPVRKAPPRPIRKAARGPRPSAVGHSICD